MTDPPIIPKISHRFGDYKIDPDALLNERSPIIDIQEHIYRDAAERVARGETVRITCGDRTVALMAAHIPRYRWFNPD